MTCEIKSKTIMLLFTLPTVQILRKGRILIKRNIVSQYKTSEIGIVRILLTMIRVKGVLSSWHLNFS